MKQYIWIAAIVAVTGANASENPFDLNTNLKKIDQSEKALLSDLSKIRGEKGSSHEVQKPAREVTAPQKVSHPAEAEKRTDTAAEKQAVSIETADEKAARLRKVQAEQERLEAERAAKKAAAERAAKEKMAAEKAAREAEELARIKKAQAEKEAKLEAEKMGKERQMVDRETPASESGDTKSSSGTIADIDIAREAELQSKAAEESLEEAIRAVDQE